MNRRSLLVLAAVAGVLVLGVILLNSGNGRGDMAGDLLLPGLRDRLNDITAVTIESAGNTTTLAKNDDGWDVREREGYPADTGKLRSAMLALADAAQLEAKTANPERHAALGLDESSAVSVSLSGDATQAVLLGDVAQQRYRYARRADDDQAWLVNQNPEVSADPAFWLVQEVLDIPAAEVSQVTILHTDGEEIRVARGDDGEFTVTNLPEDRALRYASISNATTAALQGLRLEDVRSAAALQVAPDVTTRYVLNDGSVITAHRYAEEGEAWFTFDAAPPPDAPVEVDLSTDDSADDDEELTSRERAGNIMRRVDGWAYRLATFKADALSRRWDDLLQAPGDGDS